MSNEENLTGLTRSLLLGVSLGAISLTQVGCAPQAGTTATPARTAYAAQPAPITVRSEDERQICTRALRSQSVADVNRLLTTYPDSRCIVPLLSAMPARTLAGLSPDAVAGLPSAVRGALPARVTASLPGAAPQVAGAVSQVRRGVRY